MKYNNGVFFVIENGSYEGASIYCFTVSKNRA